MALSDVDYSYYAKSLRHGIPFVGATPRLRQIIFASATNGMLDNMNVAEESVTVLGIESSISIVFYPDRNAYRLHLRHSRIFQQNVRRRYRPTLLSSLLYRIISKGSIEFIYKKLCDLQDLCGEIFLFFAERQEFH